MADYEQVSSVNIKAMGKKKGWTLSELASSRPTYLVRLYLL